jgi:hypothetical protein
VSVVVQSVSHIFSYISRSPLRCDLYSKYQELFDLPITSTAILVRDALRSLLDLGLCLNTSIRSSPFHLKRNRRQILSKIIYGGFTLPICLHNVDAMLQVLKYSKLVYAITTAALSQLPLMPGQYVLPIRTKVEREVLDEDVFTRQI